MKINEWIQRARQGFQPTFWVANTLELFERLAFYGAKAVLTVYLAIKVGLGPQVAGSLAGLFSGVIFSLPIIAGTFVDRYGFRKTLITCFSCFCVGYFLIGFAGLAFGQTIVNAIGKTPYVVTVLLLTAVGGSLIKPCIVGTSGGRTLGMVFRDMLLVFRNARFITFLVIFSGFWIMFWQIFYSFPFYIIEVLKFPKFELLETVDAWTIILLSVPLTALAKKLRPITAMTLGFLIASCSWLLIANSQTISVAIIAMAFFAVGEATQAPRFYEYVSALAPPEQVGTFMGFAFLPVAIGSFIAGPLSGWLVQTYLKDSFQPATMWYILAAIGFGATILMVLYNIFLVKRPVQA